MGRRPGGREGSTVGWFLAKANPGALEERLELATVIADTGYFSEDNTGLDLGVAPTKSDDLDEALAARIKADHPCDERQQESWAAKLTSAQARARVGKRS